MTNITERQALSCYPKTRHDIDNSDVESPGIALYIYRQSLQYTHSPPTVPIMTTERHGALVVFGSGPGIGVHVASRFARGGFEKVILLSRDGARLRNDAFIVYSNAPQVEVSTVSADLASPADLQRALRRIAEILGDTPIECIHYNAAKASRTMLLEESAVDLRANLEVSIDLRVILLCHPS